MCPGIHFFPDQMYTSYDASLLLYLLISEIIPAVAADLHRRSIGLRQAASAFGEGKEVTMIVPMSHHMIMRFNAKCHPPCGGGAIFAKASDIKPIVIGFSGVIPQQMKLFPASHDDGPDSAAAQLIPLRISHKHAPDSQRITPVIKVFLPENGNMNNHTPIACCFLIELDKGRSTTQTRKDRVRHIVSASAQFQTQRPKPRATIRRWSHQQQKVTGLCLQFQQTQLAFALGKELGDGGEPNLYYW
jgi:hypothetical protein